MPIVLACGFAMLAGCSRTPTALERQKLNHAWAYFLYSQADAQLSRMRGKYGEGWARTAVLRSLQQPDLKVVRETQGVGASVGWPINVSLSGKLVRQLEENPEKKSSDISMQIFRDAQAHWNQQEHLWHLPANYREDYNWARNEDRFRFPLAFYEDPYPATAE